MNCILLGVAKRLIKLWFDLKHRLKESYIGNQAAEVDRILSQIRPPTHITRFPGHVSKLRDWKGMSRTMSIKLKWIFEFIFMS
jgi:hypothetical protein